MLLAKITNLLLLAILTLSTVTTHASVSIINQKPLDPKEFACGNKQADPIECVSYQGGQLLTGAIVTKAVGLVIPKGTTTKVSGVTQGIDDLKKVGNYVDEVDDLKLKNRGSGADIDGIPCVSDAGDKIDSILDYAMALVVGVKVEAVDCIGGDPLPSGEFTRLSGKGKVRQDIKARNFDEATKKAEILTGLNSKNGEPVYLNNDPTTNQIVGRKGFINGKKVEIRLDPEGHPDQKFDPNSTKPHVNYEITDENGNKTFGHIFVE